MASESSVMRAVWLALAIRCTMFRANSGKAYLSGGGKVVFDANGTAHVPFARPIALGLAMTNGDTVPGLPDLFGWSRITITPEMVGRSLPVVTAVETKKTGGGRKRDDQINFIRQVHEAGGIAGFADSVESANEIIDAWHRGDRPNLG